MGSRLVLSALVLAALGAGLFFLVRGRGEGPGRGAATVAGPAAPAPEAPPGSAVLRAEPAEAAERDEPAETARQLVAAEEEPEAANSRASGSGAVRITGRVVDAAGRGLAAASVFASDRVGFAIDWAGAAPFPWLERQEARTDAEGRFELRGLSAGRLSLAVRLAGFAPYDKSGVVVPHGERHDLGDLELAAGAILSGRVVDPNGRGVAGARLLRRDPVEGPGLRRVGEVEAPLTVTDDEGAFRVDILACGAYAIEVDAADHPRKVFRGLAEEPGREISGLELRLDPGDTIEGQVVGFPEEERGELEVHARRVRADGELDFGLWSPGRVAVADDQGRFLVRGLIVGDEYVLQARRARSQSDRGFFFGSARSAQVRARAGERGVEIAYQPEATLSFQVLDAKSGEPVTSFRVEAGMDWPRPLLDDQGKALTEHPNGFAVVDGLRPSTASARATLHIEATGYRDYERDDLQVRAGEEMNLGRIFLEPVPLLRVTVLDAETGAPVQSARVRIDEQDDGSGDHMIITEEVESESVPSGFLGGGNRARTDAEGVAVLSSLEGRTCTLEVRAPGYARFELQDLFLPQGESAEERVRLSKGGRVVVTVLDDEGQPLAGRKVSHRSPSELGGAERTFVFGGSDDARDITDAEGSVAFENLELGTHAFQLDEDSSGRMPFAFGGAAEARIQVAGMDVDPDEGWTRVEVIEGDTAQVTLEAAPRGGLAGLVREAGKPLAGATLRLEEAGERGRLPRMGLDPFGGGGPRARSEGSGRYRFEDVKAGRYLLTVEHPTRRMPAEFEVEVEPGDNEFDANLSVAILEGRVTDLEGRPLAGLEVSVARAQPAGSRVEMRFLMIADDGDEAVMSSGSDLGEDVRTDAEGRYRLRGVQPEVDLVVQVEGGDVQPGRSEPVRLDPDEVKSDVDLELEPGGALEISALEDGAPARFCLAQARYADEAAGVSPKTNMIQSGATTMRGLKPGRWLVSVQRVGPGQDGRQAEPEEREVDVRAGATAQETFELD